MHPKLKASFGHSLTILWARIVALTGIALASLQSVTADPTVSDAIKSLLAPRLVPVYIIAIAVVTELLRWRTASVASPAAGKEPSP